MESDSSAVSGFGSSASGFLYCDSGEEVFDSDNLSTNNSVQGGTCDNPTGSCDGLSLRDEIARLGESIQRAVCFNSPGYFRWIADILPAESIDEAHKLVQARKDFLRRTTINSTCFIVWHQTEKKENNHAHVYHSCRFAGSFCRCPWRRGFAFRRRNQRILYTASGESESALKQGHFARWLQYFCQDGREILHMESGEMSFLKEVHSIQRLSLHSGSKRHATDGTLEEGFLPWEGGCGITPEASSMEEDQGSDRGDATSHNPKRRRVASSGYKPSPKVKSRLIDLHELVRIITTVLATPFHASCETAPWMEDPNLASFDKSDSDYKKAVSYVQRKTQSLTYVDLLHWYSAADKGPIWYSRQDGHYLPLLESWKVVHGILLHQYGSVIYVKEFLVRLYNVLEKQKPKKNSMFILGPPNCGKSYFFENIICYYLNIGHGSNACKGESFPFNEFPGKRVLIWDEPLIAPSYMETVKLIAGGNPASVNVKHQNFSVVNRTPLIFTSNNAIFNQEDPMWSTRMYFEKWKPDDELKNVTGAPNPLCLLVLWIQYQIIPFTEQMKTLPFNFERIINDILY
uniref:Nonstructural protein n=1 Tax=Turdus naumanni ambidensovirus TaxID=2794453 RepID=A0A8A4XD60_9VIRU|nr:MAG: nonstructural protein [Turdus naumanni ambidensovirus]